MDFRLPNGKIIKLNYIEDNKKKFVARAPSPNFWSLRKISVDELFFEFPYGEQVSIMYHELWHYYNNSKFEFNYRTKRPWLWVLFFMSGSFRETAPFMVR